jgi:MFS family permease
VDILDFLSNYREILSTDGRRKVILALASAFLLVQVASFPIALMLPSLATDFNITITTAAWIMVSELLLLGSTVFLAAKLGGRYGHNQAFFIGIIVATLGAGGAGFAQTFEQLLIFRGVQGVGAAFVTGNANAILAGYFGPTERARAYALPISAARFGTLMGLVIFSVFLEFVGWRAVFFTFIPLGIAVTVLSIPLLRLKQDKQIYAKPPMDYIGAFLFVGAIGVLILSGLHLHQGEESFTSGDGIRYHLPMHLVFLGLLSIFIIFERLVKNPFMDLNLFNNKHFSMALFSNTTFHLSMLTIMTMVPILVEEGFNLSPMFIIYVLLPHQILGLIVPVFAGWYYDKYNPRLLRPFAMTLIALGICLMGMFALKISFWFIPLLLFPASIGTSIFNTINNAVILNSIGLEHRDFASGMIETTRHVGHTLGATIAASAMGLALPAGILFLSFEESHEYYVRGFQIGAFSVTVLILLGAIVAFNHKIRSDSG